MHSRNLTVCFLLVTILMLFQQAAWAKPEISAANAILIEAKSGQILYNKAAFQVTPPASTTKILTALLALELAEPDEIVTVSKTAAATGEATIHLREGEKLTVGQLVKGALIRSGNDAAVAVAEHVAGNVEFFSLLMNQKARLLGAQNSNFVNPNGLPDERHRSTAFDLAVITSYALTNRMFAHVVEQKHETIPWYGGGHRYLKNTNRLLWKYSGANGVKTGTTRAAGNCLVASASRGGMQLIAVVLKSGDRYGDSIRLLDYGFQNYFVEHIPGNTVWGEIYITNGKQQWVAVKTARPLTLAYPRSHKQLVERRVELTRTIAAPVTAGSRVGTVSLYMDKEKKVSTPLVTVTAVAKEDD